MIISELEEGYKNCGWKVHFYTKTGISDNDGTVTFYSDNDGKGRYRLGTILSPEKSNTAKRKTNHTINLIRLSSFVNNIVATRKIPKGFVGEPNVVVKIDIEGAELHVIPDLIFTGAFSNINYIMLDSHNFNEKLPSRKAAVNQVIHKI